MKTFKRSDKADFKRIARDFPEFTMELSKFDKVVTISNPDKKRQKARREERRLAMKGMKKLNGGKRVDLSQYKELPAKPQSSVGTEE